MSAEDASDAAVEHLIREVGSVELNADQLKRLMDKIIGRVRGGHFHGVMSDKGEQSP